MGVPSRQRPMNFAASFSFASGARGRPAVSRKARKVRDVLMELAIDHEGSVAGEEMGHGGGRQLAGLIGVTEEKFSGGEGLHVPSGMSLPCPGCESAIDAEVIGVAEAIGEAEVFLVADLDRR